MNRQIQRFPSIPAGSIMKSLNDQGGSHLKKEHLGILHITRPNDSTSEQGEEEGILQYSAFEFRKRQGEQKHMPSFYAGRESRPPTGRALVAYCVGIPQGFSHLSGGHCLRDQPLKSKLFLLEILWGRIFDLKLSHGITKRRLNLLLVTTLELKRHSGVRNDFLHTRDVRLKLLAGLESFGESFIARLELSSI